MDMQFLRKLMPDKLYLEIMYYLHFKRFFSFSKPVTLNEKIQWLKIYDRNPDYIKQVDKIKAKKYVARKVGNKYIIPTLAVWNHAEDIDLRELPDEFILKCNHDSHCTFICTDKNKFDIAAVKKKLKKRLKYNMYWYGREWPYKKVRPRILAEKLLHPSSGETELLDYKILCFNGKPDNIMVCAGRNSGELRYYFFDVDWNFLRYQNIDMELPKDFTLPKPQNLDLMLKLASKLAEEKPLVRVDFYETDGRVWFGELTFYPCAGFDTDITREADEMLGKKLILPYQSEGRK